MKYHEKIRIETIVLILATLVLGSRELMHPFFTPMIPKHLVAIRLAMITEMKAFPLKV